MPFGSRTVVIPFRLVWQQRPAEGWFEASLTEKERMAAKRRAARTILAARTARPAADEPL